MHMTFHFERHGHVLFDWWHVDSDAKFVATCLCIVALAILFECLGEYRAMVHISSGGGSATTRRLGFKTLLHLLQLLHGYVLMLIAMTYNVFYIASILLGAGVGFFAFARTRAAQRDDGAHCGSSAASLNNSGIA